MNHDHGHKPDNGGEPRFKAKWVLIGFLAVAAYFLISEHQAHFIQALPYLLLLACPLLHVFMHGGPGHGGKREPRDKGGERE